MTLFWLSSVFLILFACVMLAKPLFGHHRFNDKVERDELNKAFYKERLNELKEEIDEGVVSDQDDLVSDLKQSLLDDIPEGSSAAVSSDSLAPQYSSKEAFSPLAVFIPSVVLLLIISYGIYFSLGGKTQVEHWHEARANLNPLIAKLMSGNGEGMSNDEMRDLMLGLRSRLHETPDDSEGWLLLGRIALSGRDLQTGGDAMKKAYKLDPANPDVRLGYAQALMMSRDQRDQNVGRNMLLDLLREDYADLRVYSMLAFDAYKREEYRAAVQYWHIMQQLLGPDDSRYIMLQRSIENAQKKIGVDGQAIVSIPVTISLAPEVQYSADAMLIVSVSDGKRAALPVAAVRYPVGSFPRTVVVDDSAAMMEGQSLSDLESIQVNARIDSDGNVATKDGDWYGISGKLKLGESVAITIQNKY